MKILLPWKKVGINWFRRYRIYRGEYDWRGWVDTGSGGGFIYNWANPINDKLIWHTNDTAKQLTDSITEAMKIVDEELVKNGYILLNPGDKLLTLL
jgi:hypothetical protein